MHSFKCHIDIGPSLACSAKFTPSHLHALMMWLFWLSAILPATSCYPPSLLSSCSSSWSSPSSSVMWATSTLRTLANQDFGTLAEYDPLTSFVTGQCIYSERFLRVHLSHWMYNQFTLHREFRIDTRRTIWAKDRRYSSRLWIQWTRNMKIQMKWTWRHRVLLGTSKKYGRNINTLCIRLTSN